jgi:hypothetical protein
LNEVIAAMQPLAKTASGRPNEAERLNCLVNSAKPSADSHAGLAIAPIDKCQGDFSEKNHLARRDHPRSGLFPAFSKVSRGKSRVECDQRFDNVDTLVMARDYTELKVFIIDFAVPTPISMFDSVIDGEKS